MNKSVTDKRTGYSRVQILLRSQCFPKKHAFCRDFFQQFCRLCNQLEFQFASAHHPTMVAQSMQRISFAFTMVLLAFTSGCVTHTPQACPPPPQEKIEAAKAARENSISRLHSYQIGKTTEDDFLRTGWRLASITRPFGDVGILSERGMTRYSELSVMYSEYVMGYIDFDGSDKVEVCTLHFDAAGLLQSIVWK